VSDAPPVVATNRRPPTDPIRDEDRERLVEAARNVRKNAYAPYSKYRVGAALLTPKGLVFSGCNVENSTYGATICAERAAVTAMVAAGEKIISACAVVTGGEIPGSPCGICRQVLFEFADDFEIVLVGETGSAEVRKSTSLGALLPDGFRLTT
jgi:cytidine deaminase